jgi:hypothetical protein
LPLLRKAATNAPWGCVAAWREKQSRRSVLLIGWSDLDRQAFVAEHRGDFEVTAERLYVAA